MKNVTVVIVTTFALVTTAMAVEIARRQASVADVVRASDALNASAEASAAEAQHAAPAAAPQTLGATDAAMTESALPTPSAEAVAPEQAPMRDASPLTPLTISTASEKDPGAKTTLFTIPQGPAPALAADAPQTKSGGENGTANDAKAAIVKPSVAKPASRKSATEKAGIDRPASLPSAPPSDRAHRVATARSERDAEQPARERHAAPRSFRYARWQGGDSAHLRAGPDAYGFSGSFGGCVYRGVVSVTGYRIERSC
ncbi:hypothetical protein [Methylocella tundrae]|uniref:Translation initiation factor IF-2 n=1 Tax=Methylocella tundrae TaxID=227605 RepID=A0A4U8YVB4_METTU|nr:hypothetical protein [Methylocella tundrae]WPP05349.1 hypothetical protein SIN04_05845 [Methylocella tundrae]VFU07718.1 conserved exported protein of unknown function [Methylocella tundrae]